MLSLGFVCLLGFGVFAVAVASTLLIVPRVIVRARAWNVLDLPDRRKIHLEPTPRLGGLGLFPAIWLGTSVAILTALHSDKLNGLAGTQFSSNALSLFGFLIGGTGMFALGCIDDLKGLSAGQKLIAQSIISLVSIQFLPIPTSMLGAELSPAMGAFLLFSWLTIVPNSVNLLDGIDGLTSTLLLVFGLVISILAFAGGQYPWVFVGLAFAGACTAFLKFNWSPAKIFLGDSGSLLLGFLVAYASVFFAMRAAPTAEIGMEWNPIISVLLCGVWLLDTTASIVRRYARQAPTLRVLRRVNKFQFMWYHQSAVRNIFRPDREHLHHKLLESGLLHTGVVGVLTIFFGICAISAIALQLRPTTNGIWILTALALPLFAMAGLLHYCYVFQPAKRVPSHEAFAASTDVRSKSAA